jgi:MFS transporter, DHA2 family, multidrug resistance protein
VLGLGALQIMLDRGEDDDWLSSGFIRVMAVLAATGIVGGIYWLLYAKKPIVNLRALGDKNFALGCVMIFAMALMLYSSAVLIPQFSQQQLGYTATLAGLILTPGAIALIVLIVLVGRLMPLLQTRFIIAFGFVFLGSAFIYSHGLTPNIDFKTLMWMRIVQTMGLGFLFVPISSIAYQTLPHELNADAAALFTMFRNVAGSIGISVSTAMLTTRSQVHMVSLGGHLNPFSQAYTNTVAAISKATTSGASAVGVLYRDLIHQSQLLAYMDVFAFCAAVAFLAAPLALFFSPVKAGSAIGKGEGEGA